MENVVEEEFSESEEGENDTEVQKRGPGRPSKNRESAIKRKRGRPPGSLNKKKKLSGVSFFHIRTPVLKFVL